MVPKGWQITKLDEIADKVMVGIASAATHAYAESGVRMLRNLNIKDGWVDDSDILYVNEEYELKFKNKRLKTGDILTVRTGYPGLSAVVPSKYEGAQCFTSLITRLDRDQALPDYVCRYINSEYGKKFVASGEAGGAQKNVNAGMLKRMLIPLPPLVEQQKIARILSTWDEVIATTERLLANSEQQKKALVQQLLTGKKRLPGFGAPGPGRFGRENLPDGWSYVSLGEIADEVVDRNKEQANLPVLSCSKYDGFVDSLKYFKKKVYSDDTSNYKIVRRGEFGFPANHVEEGSIGLQGAYDKGIVSPIYVVFRANPDRVENFFLFKVLKTDHYRQVFSAATSASVDRRGSLRWKQFSRIKVSLPGIEEQKAISRVIASAEKESALLRHSLEALQAEKKALMQQLLTGKRRVKVDEPETEAAHA